jgi:hypothetical protein
MSIAVLTVMGDFMDAMGSSTGILMGCNMLYYYFE